MNKTSISFGISAILIGFILIINNLRKTNKTSLKYSLLMKLFGEKTNHVISFISNIFLILFGLAIIVFDISLKNLIIIGLFFIIIGIKNTTGEFSNRKKYSLYSFDENVNKKTNFVTSLISSILLVSVGTGILIWQIFIFN